MFQWWISRYSKRGRAISLYKRGLAKARRHDHHGAIVDYTTTIAMADSPIDVRAMALYNRALMYFASDDAKQGVADLNAVLAMKEMLINVKSMARQKLARLAAQPRRRTRQP